MGHEWGTELLAKLSELTLRPDRREPRLTRRLRDRGPFGYASGDGGQRPLSFGLEVTTELDDGISEMVGLRVVGRERALHGRIARDRVE